MGRRPGRSVHVMGCVYDDRQAAVRIADCARVCK